MSDYLPFFFLSEFWPCPSSEGDIPHPADQLHYRLSRRQFVAALGLISGGAAFSMPGNAAAGTFFQSPAVVESPSQAAATVPVKLTINGEEHSAMLDPRVTLLDLLREHLDLTGTKKGCDHGQCGACTVLANGRRINSCLSLAVVHDGDEITTIEGLAKGAELHPMQAAFVDHDGLQCGYCTPGQICSAVALLEECRRGDASFVTGNLSDTKPVSLTPAEIRERMSGNICRCGAYPGILGAIQSVQKG